MDKQPAYDYRLNTHTLAGPAEVLKRVVEAYHPRSLVDVGCGPGTWLTVAHQQGLTDIFGVDFFDNAHLFPPAIKHLFRRVDLSADWSLDRRFDVALCLEVAEHLPHESSATLVRCLTRHADTVVFSAAAPRQGGQNHINCQWPSFWQRLFNQQGYACDDRLRWLLWDRPDVEPWYRQNLFVASKVGEAPVQEPPLKSVYHPDVVSTLVQELVQRQDTVGAHVKAVVRKALGRSS